MARTTKQALLDTSFFIRLTNSADPLATSAREYLHYLSREGAELYISTIAIAEWCVKGQLHALPLDRLRILPFNADDAQEAGTLCNIAITELKAYQSTAGTNRLVVPNDCKMFGQANVRGLDYFITSDGSACRLLSRFPRGAIRFQPLDISVPAQTAFGELFPLD